MRSVFRAFFDLPGNPVHVDIVAESEAEARDFAGDKVDRVERVSLGRKGVVGDE